MNTLPADVIFDILSVLEPQDLLSLYISDPSLHTYLNDKSFLSFLSTYYLIKSTSFTSWYKLYNESLLKNHPELYL